MSSEPIYPQYQHDAAETIAGGPIAEEGPGSLRPLRNGSVAAIGVIAFVVFFLSSYSGAFGDPTPHHVPVAAVAPESVVRQLDASPALQVDRANSAAQARRLVDDRTVYGALILRKAGQIQVDIASGGGRAVAVALTDIGTTMAQKSGTRLSVDELAPLSDRDPAGTVEFYCIIFLTLAASLGATVLGRALGTVRNVKHSAQRAVVLTCYTAVLSAVFVAIADAGFGALIGHAGALFLIFWAYATAVCLAVTGVAARLGTVAALVVTAALVILGNTSAGGPVPRPMLNAFFSALTPVFPQGAGMTIVRGMLYFHGYDITTGAVTLAVWGGIGLSLLAAAAFRTSHGQTALTYVAQLSRDAKAGNEASSTRSTTSPSG